MKRIASLFAICFATSFCHAQHPRLFFDSTEAIDIRNRALVSNSTENKFYLEIQEIADYLVANRIALVEYYTENNAPGFVRQFSLFSLAFTYFVSQQPIYLQKVRDIIFGYDGQPALLSYPFLQWNSHLVGGLAQTVDLLWNEFSEGARDSILQKIRGTLYNPSRPGDGVRDYFYNSYRLHDNNHMARIGMGLLSAAIVFHGDPAYPEADSDIAAVRYRIVTYQNNLIVRMNHSDGAPAEGVAYGSHEYYNEIPILHALGRWDNVDYLHDSMFASRYTKAGKYFCYEVLPGSRNRDIRQFTAINDAWMAFTNHNSQLAGLHILSSVYIDGYAKWVFNSTAGDISDLVRGSELYHAPVHNACRGFGLVEALNFNNDTPPVNPSGILPKSKYFPVRGLVYIRTSDNWADNNDIQFSLTAAPAIDRSLNPPNGVLSVKHNQPDKNSITISAYGEDFIIDVGYRGQRPEDQNYILIDGRGQSPNAINGGMNEGRIVQYQTAGTFDFVHSDAKLAFDTYYYHGENGTPVPVIDPTNSVLNADRYVLSTRATPSTRHFFVVADDINRNNQFHEYKWVFNTDSNVVIVNQDKLFIESGGKYLKIWHTQQGIPFVQVQTKTMYDHLISEEPTQVFQTDISTTAINPFFHYVMVPQPSDESYPTVVNLNDQVTNGSCIKLTWSTDEDYSFFKYAGTLSASFVATDGKLSQVRKGISSGLPSQFAMAEGSNFTFDGRELVNLYGQQGTVMKEGSSVSISGATGYFRIYCPSATSVKVNGNDVAFVQVGDYVEPPHVTINRTWSGNISSAYDITIDAGVALTVSAGSNFSLSPGTSIEVNGEFSANGSTITCPNGKWSGITNSLGPPTVSLNYCNISNAYTALNVGSWTTLTVDHCSFTNCDIGINIFSSAHALNPTLQISNNTFSDFPLNCTGIAIDQYSDVLIASDTLTGPVVKGTGIYLNGSSPRMVGNIIQSFKNALVCLSGSPAMLEEVEGPGNNMIMNNINAVSCDMSDAILGGDYGGNSICMNSSVDVYVDGGSTVMATNNSWASNGCDPNNPPGTFVIINGELKYEPCAGSCGGASPIAGGKNEQELDEGEPMMTPVPALITQALRERRRGNHAQADLLLRAIVANGSITREWKQWALGQLLAVGQRLRNRNLASYFNTVATSQPPLARQARALLPSSFISEGSFVDAMAAYDANIRQYPNSNLERSALYGKFTYQLYHRHDTTQARSLLNQLIGGYPQSREAEIAELQMSVFRSSSALNRMNGGAGTLANTSGSLSPPTLPKEFALSRNYPNPFNPETQINFDLPEPSQASLVVYDVLGRKVAELVNGYHEAGYHSATWNAQDVSSGVYFARFTATDPNGSLKYSKINKLVLTK